MKLIIEHTAFENKLALGEIEFEYTKKDGSIRNAKGTTRLDLIPEGLQPRGGVKATRGTPYFDLELNEWRSISTDSDITTTNQILSELPGIPSLTDEEVQYMLWFEGDLKDTWLRSLISLIHDATPQDASELINGKFKNLIRVTKKCTDDPIYFSELKEKWYKIIRE